MLAPRVMAELIWIIGRGSPLQHIPLLSRLFADAAVIGERSFGHRFNGRFDTESSVRADVPGAPPPLRRRRMKRAAVGLDVLPSAGSLSRRSEGVMSWLVMK